MKPNPPTGNILCLARVKYFYERPPEPASNGPGLLSDSFGCRSILAYLPTDENGQLLRDVEIEGTR